MLPVRRDNDKEGHVQKTVREVDDPAYQVH